MRYPELVRLVEGIYMFKETSAYADELSYQVALFYDRNYHDLLNVVGQFVKGEISQSELEVFYDSFLSQMHLVEREFAINCRVLDSRKSLPKFLREWFTRRSG